MLGFFSLHKIFQDYFEMGAFFQADTLSQHKL